MAWCRGLTRAKTQMKGMGEFLSFRPLPSTHELTEILVYRQTQWLSFLGVEAEIIYFPQSQPM